MTTSQDREPVAGVDGKRAGVRWAVRLAGLGLVLVTPVATWWLVGDLSTVPVAAGGDYAFRPWPVGPATERAVGMASLVLSTGTIAVLGWATRRRLLDGRWWSVLIPLVAAGAFAGAGWRVMTAGVIGANIGAGLVVFFGGPVVGALLVWALARSTVLLVQAHRRRELANGPDGG